MADTATEGSLVVGGHIPIRRHLDAEIDQSARRDIDALAARIRCEDRRLRDPLPFGQLVTTGFGPYPNLVIEDHSGIALFEVAGESAYAYRALLLAGEGDLFAVGVDRSPGFERYCRDRLELGAVEVLSPADDRLQLPVAQRCARDEGVLTRAAEVARAAGGLNLLPYMGNGGVWRLAAEIAGRAGVPVRVAAPPPELTKRVNDKLWFTRAAAALLGQAAVPQSEIAFGPATLAASLRRLARRHRTVAVKLAASASSAGNFVFDSSEIADASLTEIRDRTLARMKTVGWRGNFPVAATAWEAPLVASPSVQLWIPDRDEENPLVEGIFDQALLGESRAFGGAMPSRLGADAQGRLATEATKLALLFQALGYYGRCSFDVIVIGERDADAEFHWIECNGRWGGVSIPMTLANRLLGDWRQAAFLVVERSRMEAAPPPLEQALDYCSDELLYRAGGPSRGVVILSPSHIESGKGFEILVFGRDRADAERQALAFSDRLAAGRLT